MASLARGALALALALASRALVVVAERASEVPDDATSMMQMTRQLSSTLLQVDDQAPCTDTAPPGAQDSLNFGCGFYDAYPFLCQNYPYDDSDFTKSLMCCVCLAPTPTPTPGGGASATGDPHVSNVDGVRFNIMRSGVHEFLRLPRRANRSGGFAEPQPLLSVLATVERADDDECHESYLKQVYMAGGWLSLSGPLRLRAEGAGPSDPRAVVVTVNGTNLDRDALHRRSAALPFLEVTEPAAPRGAHAPDRIQKVPMFTVRLSFAAATLQVDWVHRAVPGGATVNHLNFQAFGLRRFVDSAGMDIGGILGRDDHGDAASLPPQCNPSDADLRVSGRQNSETSDLQVIAAAL